MTPFDLDRLRSAYQRARDDLLAERNDAGHWVGELSSSALSTATAVSALALAERRFPTPLVGAEEAAARTRTIERVIIAGLRYLADSQNDDGGWGDTDKSRSNIATTMLAEAAFHLTGVPAAHGDVLQRARAYLRTAGGIPALRRRYGRDKTFAVPILTNCALAGLVPWREVTPLPFELACLPRWTLKFLRLPVVSYALPALIAIGLARFFHAKPLNPLVRVWRSAAVEKSLDVLTTLQPESGGFLEATPLTSFVVMSLAGIGRADHPVARRGVEFLIASARDDGSWPIDTNLATWNTSLALNALASGGASPPTSCLDWLLSCQHLQVHPFTDAAPGGWGWSDLSGAVPDADDTPAALLALTKLEDCVEPARRPAIRAAVLAGIAWLLALQNRDGGWPTFCRGWGTLPFDRSGADLTAHALRALDAWSRRLTAEERAVSPLGSRDGVPLGRRIERAIRHGLAFLLRRQRADGSWVPLWFGNEAEPGEENPVYGTARVLLAFRDLDRLGDSAAQRGLAWLRAHQNRDGGWGGRPAIDHRHPPGRVSSVEETALAVEALLADETSDPLQHETGEGLAWLMRAVEKGCYRETSPIGFYFARLWYYEKLYPLSFTVSALGQAVGRLGTPTTRHVLKLHPHPA